jgi:hypothetical protein
MSRYTRVVSGQRLGKHVSEATYTKATIEKMFSMKSVPKCYKQSIRLKLVDSSVLEFLKRGHERETGE